MTKGKPLFAIARLAIRVKRLWRARKPMGERGSAAVEFAFVVPAIGLAMIPTYDLGMGVYRSMQVHNAAQAGADYAIAHGYDKPSLQGVVTGATSYPGIAASPDPATFFGCPTYTGITVVSSGSKCDFWTNPGTYVTVSASATYTTIISYPLLPSSYPLAATSTVRVQ